MKRFIVLFLLSLFIGCQEQPGLSQVISKRPLITKGMPKDKVLNTLKVDPDEISQVGNVEVWIYKGVVGKESKTFNDFIIKFKNNKVIYTGFFKCKLPKEE